LFGATSNNGSNLCCWLPQYTPWVQEGAGPWSGTARCFRADNGELFYFTVIFGNSEDFCRYCTAQLETNGITKFSVKQLGRMSYYEGDKPRSGFVPHPDRVEVSIGIEDKIQGTTKFIRFFYMLPESSRALGSTPSFTKLGRDEKIARCVDSVTVDMKGIAQELVHKLKDS
jgi:hypothetical protein